MITKEAVINNQVGLHARPATFFIQKANEFKSSIWIEKDERRVNAKSLLGVLSLGIVKGTVVTLVADGTDEQEALIPECTKQTSAAIKTFCLAGIQMAMNQLNRKKRETPQRNEE